MMNKHLSAMIAMAWVLSACQSPMPPRIAQPPTQPNSDSPAATPVPTVSAPVPALSGQQSDPGGPKVIQVEPKAEGLGDPTEGIDPTIPLETSVTPKLEPLVKGTIKPYVVNGETVTPMTTLAPFSQTGIASWYGKKFHGLKTASGEPYNMFKLSGAHQKLPIPSYVRVTNLDNQKTVVVRINDRGPFAHNRIIDLSYAAAKQLDLLKHGSGRVALRLIDPTQPEAQASDATRASTPEPTNARPALPTLAATGTYVQLGAFGDEQNADRLYQRIARHQPDRQPLLNKVYNGKVFQVVLGPYPDHALATQAASDLRAQLQLPTFTFNRP